jgi:hypothetical protein
MTETKFEEHIYKKKTLSTLSFNFFQVNQNFDSVTIISRLGRIEIKLSSVEPCNLRPIGPHLCNSMNLIH